MLFCFFIINRGLSKALYNDLAKGFIGSKKILDSKTDLNEAT